jgi:hypothetical protein
LSRTGAHICSPLTVTSCENYASIGFWSGNKKVITIRSYPKVLDLLGEVGGTGELIFIFASVLYLALICSKREKYEMKHFSKVTPEEADWISSVKQEPVEEK